MIAIAITFTIILWLAFIAITHIVDMKNDTWQTLNPIQKAAAAMFLATDVIHNYTAGSILFWEIADNERKTLTARLKHILHSGLYTEDEWRYKLAMFFCLYLIEPWDMGHCSL